MRFFTPLQAGKKSVFGAYPHRYDNPRPPHVECCNPMHAIRNKPFEVSDKITTKTVYDRDGNPVGIAYMREVIGLQTKSGHTAHITVYWKDSKCRFKHKKIIKWLNGN